MLGTAVMGHFRQDLFVRLSGATLTLPALRQRTDCSALIQKMMHEEAARAGCDLAVSNEVMQMLLSYDWPGNLRELRHTLRFAVALAVEAKDGHAGTHGAIGQLLLCHLPPLFQSVRESDVGASVSGDSRDIAEARMIRVALDRTCWNVTATAILVDVSRATLHRKIRRYGLQRR